MPLHRQRRKPDRGRSREETKERKRTLSPEYLKAQQFRRDVLRRGLMSEILRLYEGDTELELAAAEDSLLEISEENEALADASEVSLADDDAWLLDEPEIEWDAEAHTSGLPEGMYIHITHGHAEFFIPDWAYHLNEDDLLLRWETYTKLADWLNRERREFLRNPSYLSMAGTVTSPSPPVPILQAGLAEILNLNCDPTTFSKHCEQGWLVWRHRLCRIEDLWSQEAKLAWFARAVISRQQQRGYLDRNSLLASPAIQPPRSKKQKDDFIKRVLKQVERLGPEEYVALLCCMTGCAWDHVLDRYASEIFYQETTP